MMMTGRFGLMSPESIPAAWLELFYPAKVSRIFVAC
jgi:hypothetical protein